jgi:hypothetical protein
MTSPDRDVELGSVLRQLDVPEHGPEFFSRLLERLEAEARETVEPSPVARRSSRRRPPRFLGLVAAVLLVVLGVSWLALPGGRRPGLGPGVATATEIQARVARAFSSLRTLRGEATIEYPSIPATVRSSFVITATGDFRVVGITRREGESYNSATGVYRSYQVAASGRVVATESRGAAPGPPDHLPSPSLLERSVGSLVRAFLAADIDRPVQDVDYEGRPAWRVVVPVSIDLAPGPDGAPPGPVGEIDVTVDRQTGFPVRTITSSHGAVSSVVRLSELQVDAPDMPTRLDVAFPPGTLPVAGVDLGFRRVPLVDVATAVGYTPLVPETVPGGFRLAEVAVADETPVTGVGNPRSARVVSLAYQRGFDRLVVTTRATGGDPTRWSDPVGRGSGPGTAAPEPVTLTGGALDGAAAEVVLRTQDVPHAWAVTDRLVVTVAGDLSRSELVDVMQSLSPYEE